MKKRIYIMVGVPGSGKSTWLQKHKQSFAPTHAIISRDEIRFSMVKENEEYFSKEKEVFNDFICQIKKSLVNNQETYVDATHLNEASRSKLFRALGKSLKDVYIYAIVIKKPLDKIIKQNSNRTGRAFVPEMAIKRMYSSFTIPTLEEGFNEIIIYTDDTKVTIFK